MKNVDDYLITSHSFRPRNSKRFYEDHQHSYIIRKELLGVEERKFAICPSLTILVPSCSKHRESTELLCNELDRQGLHYIVDGRDDVDLGTKRQDMYKQCESVYCIQWDADDFIHGMFASIIDPLLKTNVDCINFLEHVVMGSETTITRRSINYPWSGIRYPNGNYCFSPNTKSIVKTQIAQMVEFEKGQIGEDLAFGRDLRPYLKTEVNIDEILYYYEYCDEGSTTHTNSEENRRRRADGL